MKRILTLLNSIILLMTAGCHHSEAGDPLVAIQIQDRNGMTETLSNPERLVVYEATDFLSAQPYKKVLRVFKKNNKNHSIITTYHPNGTICHYLEAEEMRAHGAYREWFPNGQLKIEATVISGTADVSPGSQQDWLFDGLSQVWDDQGILTAQIPYEKGMLEGDSLYYYPSGIIHKRLTFTRNAQEGVSLEFFPNGLIKSKTNYKKGVKDGMSQGFFEDGQMAWDELHCDGYLQSGAYYNPKGELVSEVKNGGGFQAAFQESGLLFTEFRCGRPEGLVKKYTPNGELKNSFHIKKGMKQGEEIEYFTKMDLEDSADSSKPLPKLSINWNENMVHGTVKTWYNNGKLQSQRTYSQNRKLGSSLAWYRDGSLMMIEEYENELLIKGQYFKKQQKELVSTVNNGNGLVSLYDENGIFLRKVAYLKGKPIDPEK